ncbi:TetR/AcrR family transcriptional regulator [Catenulispora sp. NL8]|uniref:TetR/AcrR family transcriptional regulator n=1 Tax=Catenulispora pinistramenti TaxID=2705254 RepID=A0ABS5KR96_9ACTN|nr:TetR/AcrR family transcriptional regulator [Catenulispora pinistramenti]MBS2548549.1 TetR/AcrR family transcriptional regulator [Catenulispora pinistramenti]
MAVPTILPPLPGARDARDPKRAIKRGPSRLPREQVAAAQRERVYDGLVRMVAENGYANASVSSICRASGVTRPTFYEHFESKEGAFLAACRHGNGVMFTLVRQAYTAEATWAKAICSSLQVLLSLLASVPAFATAAVVEIEAMGPVGRQARAEQLARFLPFFQPAPPTPPGVDRRELIQSVIGGVHATLFRFIASGRTAELPNLRPTLVYSVMAPFAGPEAALSAGREPIAEPLLVAPCTHT